MRPRQLRIEAERARERLLRPRHVALLQLRPGNIHPAVGVRRIDLGHAAKAADGALEIALQQQPDAVIVPSLARRRTAAHVRGRPWRLCRRDRHDAPRLRHHRNGQVRNRLHLA